jgi:hypothetical protein
MSAFIPEIRYEEPPANPRRKGCIISAVTSAGVVVIATLILLPAINASRTAARRSQLT